MPSDTNDTKAEQEASKPLAEPLATYGIKNLAIPALPEEPTASDIERYRDCIDALDQLLLRILNERSHCANSIGQIKRQLDLPVYMPAREKVVLKNVMSANEGPLDDLAVRRLFERIIDETRALERKVVHDSKESP